MKRQLFAGPPPGPHCTQPLLHSLESRVCSAAEAAASSSSSASSSPPLSPTLSLHHNHNPSLLCLNHNPPSNLSCSVQSKPPPLLDFSSSSVPSSGTSAGQNSRYRINYDLASCTFCYTASPTFVVQSLIFCFTASHIFVRPPGANIKTLKHWNSKTSCNDNCDLSNQTWSITL